MEHWGAIEADFLRFYSIDTPLSLPWHNFLNYVSYLPPDDSAFLKILQNDQLEVTEDGEVVKKDTKDTKKARQMLQAQHKRTKPRERISLDDLMGSGGGAYG